MGTPIQATQVSRALRSPELMSFSSSVMETPSSRQGLAKLRSRSAASLIILWKVVVFIEIFIPLYMRSERSLELGGSGAPSQSGTILPGR